MQAHLPTNRHHDDGRYCVKTENNPSLGTFHVGRQCSLSLKGGNMFKRTSLLLVVLTQYSVVLAHPGINDIPSAPHGATFMRPMIGGMPFTCIAANGQAVPTLSNHLLPDVGRADIIAGHSVISMNPHVLLSMPPENQRFWYAHECAHVHLPTTNEDVADCYATKIGRNQGWLSPQGIQSICAYFQSNPGDWSHSPGPARCQNIATCYSQP